MTKKVELKRTQVFTITSEINFQKYDLYIRLPNSYTSGSTHDEFDVLYVLNGQWDFGLMLSIYGSCYYDGLLPNILVVGISWNEQETDDEAKIHGSRDFTAFIENGETHGGAKMFLNVIEKELIPFVEAKFATSATRCISGSSNAGFFALFAMLHKPNLFQKYILSSPTTWLFNGVIFVFESLFSKKSYSLDADLYISYGELEDSSLIKEFIKCIQSRGYKNLSIKDEEVMGTGHAGNKPIGYTNGLIHSYRKPKITVDNRVLKNYCGQYRLGEKFVTVALNNESLLMYFNELEKGIPLYADNDSTFYTKAFFSTLKFTISEDGRVSLSFKTFEENFIGFKEL